MVKGAEGSLERLAYDSANLRLWMIAATYFVCGLMEDCSGVLRGLGKSLLSMVVVLVGTCLLRVVWILVAFPLKPTLEMIFICYPISWVLTGIASFIVIQVLLKKVLMKYNAIQ